jgi:hypothetical protein
MKTTNVRLSGFDANVLYHSYSGLTLQNGILNHNEKLKSTGKRIFYGISLDTLGGSHST